MGSGHSPLTPLPVAQTRVEFTPHETIWRKSYATTGWRVTVLLRSLAKLGHSDRAALSLRFASFGSANTAYATRGSARPSSIFGGVEPFGHIITPPNIAYAETFSRNNPQSFQFPVGGLAMFVVCVLFLSCNHKPAQVLYQ